MVLALSLSNFAVGFGDSVRREETIKVFIITGQATSRSRLAMVFEVHVQ